MRGSARRSRAAPRRSAIQVPRRANRACPAERGRHIHRRAHRHDRVSAREGETLMMAVIPAKLRAPGWYRAALYDVLGFGFAVGLTALIRFLMHQHPVFDPHAITIVALIAVPLFFLVGLGTADYWFYWASGRPTRAEDHSSHGALTWRDYFRVN